MSGCASALRQVFISSYIVNAQFCAYIPLWICSALSLLVLRVLADNHDSSLSLDNLALLAHRFHRRTNLHNPASFLDVSLFQYDSVKGHKNPMPESAEIINQLNCFCKIFLSWQKPIGNKKTVLKIRTVSQAAEDETCTHTVRIPQDP